MSIRGDINIMEDTFLADQAIGKYRVVTYGAQNIVTLGAAKASKIAGVTQNATSASGDAVRVRQLGKSLVTISSAGVTIGVPLLISDANGRVSNVGGATGDGILGVPEEAGSASGDQITCFLQIRRA